MSNPTYVVMQTQRTILELLKLRGYDVGNYVMSDDMSQVKIDLTEIENLLKDTTPRKKRSDSLRMEVTHPKGHKACVLFLLYPIKHSISSGKFLELLMPTKETQKKLANDEPNTSIYTNDGSNTIEFTDIFINYIPAEPNEDTSAYDKEVYKAWKKHKILLQFFPLGTLVSNPLKHILQPKFQIVPDSEKNDVLKFWYAKTASQLPSIRFHSDMAARCLGLKPGDFVKIIMPSPTAGEYMKYRVCQP